MNARGTTLLETMIGAMLLCLMMAALFFIYQMGASAWKKGEAQTELMADIETCHARLIRELERSTYASLSLDPVAPPGPAISFLSAVDDAGQFCFDTVTQQIQWQKYVAVYYDAASREVRWREIALAPGAPEANTPEPIESYDAGGGAPLATYLTGGQAMARNISSLQMVWSNGVLELTTRGERKRYGSERLEEFSLRSVVGLRN